MNQALSITQVIIGGVALIVILVVIGVLILSVCENILNRSFLRGQQAQWEKDRSRMRDNSIWFSEDEPTQKLVDSIFESGDMFSLREKWRTDRKAADRTKQIFSQLKP